MPNIQVSDDSSFFSPITRWFKEIGEYFSSSNNRYQHLKKDDDYDLESKSDEETEATDESSSLSNWQLMMKLSEVMFSKENSPQVLLVGCLTLVNMGLNFLTPYLLSETVELCNSDEEQRAVLGLEVNQQTLITMLLMSYTISQLIPNYTKQQMTSLTMQNAEREVEKIAKHLLEKSFNYHATTSSGEQNRLFQKGFTVSTVGSPILTTVLPKLTEVFSASILLSNQYGWEVGLSLLAMLAVYSKYSLSQVDTIIKNREISLEKNNESWGQLENAIKNYKVMHDFNKLEYTLEKLHDCQIDFIEHYIKAENFPVKVGFSQVLMVRAYTMATCLYVANQLQRGEVSVSSFLALLGYLNQLSLSLPEFGQALNDVIAAIPDLNFVFSELAKGSEIRDPHPERLLPIEAGIAPGIEFSNLAFQYPASSRLSAPKPVFENMSFVIEPGEIVALVSESGVGKTTLFNLLYGYYQPNCGVIKINGEDLSELSLQDVQKNIAIFGQTANLFKGSIRENIAYGAENPDEISDQEILQLATDANLAEFLLSFPNGLDEQVGDGGKALSGGQQQKVAILRAMLKKSPIRLLDEVTASCDNLSGEQILKAMVDSRSGKTTLMITHKLKEVQYVDTIIVIGKEGLIAKGTHQQLLNTCPFYCELYTMANGQPAKSQGGNESRTCSTGLMARELGPFSEQTAVVENREISLEDGLQTSFTEECLSSQIEPLKFH